MTIQDLLRHTRKASGLTQAQLAEKIGVYPRDISNLENSNNDAIVIQRINAILELVYTDIDILVSKTLAMQGTRGALKEAVNTFYKEEKAIASGEITIPEKDIKSHITGTLGGRLHYVMKCEGMDEILDFAESAYKYYCENKKMLTSQKDKYRAFNAFEFVFEHNQHIWKSH